MARIDRGFVNAHTHLYSGLSPLGLPPLDPPPRNFLDILARRWWILDRALDHDILLASARFCVANALLAGTTVLVDHHESPHCIEGSLDVIADACQDLGIRAVVCYGTSERNHGEKEALAGLEENRRFIEENQRPLVRGAVGLHASFTLGDASIRRAGDLARRLRAPIHVHVAEDMADVEDAKQRGYAGPLERLLALDALPPNSILAHGVHLTRANVQSDLANVYAWIVQNPRSNEANGVGYARVLGLEDRVALGTDGFPSNMQDERDALERIAKKDDEVSAAELVQNRLEASSRLAYEFFGARSDDHVEWDENFSARAPRSVTIAGRELVRDGNLVSGNLPSIREEAERAAARLFERMQSTGDKP
ncbi:MAG: amidohydrolase family protein [Polyangiaceae bacterium]|nr:amidohydrolase family protein [Polyangiaceae bacterium]